MNSVDPSVLVDGRVLEVGSGNEVFIDRGEKDHIVLGMTFDIYESASQLRLNSNGNLPRGKATIEVVKVGPTTSTAKIKRSTSSQPIIRDNIIVNPIYDPEYKFSFVVHGNFDADGDGEPESNNSFIKNQITRWGGIVVQDDGVIPGDLDFLVLGVALASQRISQAKARPTRCLMRMLHNKVRTNRILIYSRLRKQRRFQFLQRTG